MSLVQKKVVSSGGASSVSASLTGVAAGNLLVLLVAGNQYGGSPVDFATPSGWSKASSYFNSSQINGASYINDAIFYLPNASAGSHSVSISANGGSSFQGALILCEFSGYTATPLDASSAGGQTYTTSGTKTASTGNTAAVAQASELVVGVMSMTDAGDTSNAAITDPPVGFTSLTVQQITNNTPYVAYEAAYLESTTLSGAQSVSWSYTSADASNGYSAAIATFKASGGGTAYNQSVSGTITPTGSTTLAVRVAMALAGSVTLTAALARRTAISLTGAVTAAGTIAKRAGKSLAGSVTGSGSLKRSTSTKLAGSTTPTGTLSETAVLQKSVSGAIALSTTIATVLIQGGGAAKRAMTQIALFLGIRL